ncbi:hypothetical protein C8R44DRAFT_771138 [Mycena epipterygia]|nr:hypothetical protein C8R44DRAFT_771138 [Mycena epipterygia]
MLHSTLPVFCRLRPAAPAFRRRIQSMDALKIEVSADKGSDSQAKRDPSVTSEMTLFAQDRDNERTLWDVDRDKERSLWDTDRDKWDADRDKERSLWNTRISKLEAKIERIQKEANAEALSAALANQANLRKISDLQTYVQKIQNNLHLRSALEIVAEVLRLKANQQPRANLRLASGVQAVLNAIGKGSFDAPGTLAAVHYVDAQAAVIAAVAAGGVKTKDIAEALGKLYGELSKHHYHGGVTEQIEIRDGEQTMAETVAAMSVLLFARRLFGCQLDAVYTDAAGKSTVVSQL